jgi:hypothetical protein
MSQGIKTLLIDKDLLYQNIVYFYKRLQYETDQQIKKKYREELQVCKNLVETGISTHFDYTRNGRSKAKGAANHLNNSKERGKKGYSFWQALRQNELFEIDLNSAEILMMSIVAGDKHLFESIMKGDIYMQAVEILGLPKEKSYRKLVKNLWLRYQYQQSINSIREDEPENLELFKKLRNYLKVTYPEYFKGVDKLVHIDRRILKDEIFLKLPNEFPLCLEPGQPMPFQHMSCKPMSL